MLEIKLVKGNLTHAFLLQSFGATFQANVRDRLKSKGQSVDNIRYLLTYPLNI